MTNTEPPSPFRRFPWMQLVFCIACLTMAGWTWMRFSYAWGVTPDDFRDGHRPVIFEDFYEHPLYGRYVALTGVRNRAILSNGWVQLASVSDGSARTDAYMGQATLPLSGQTVTIRGLVMPGGTHGGLVVNADYSRPISTSVAGLVVGAMGCFIFGLYLRRWLRARKALASEPLQDMIA